MKHSILIFCNSELYFVIGKICFSTLLDIVWIKNGWGISMCCDNIFEINVIRFNSYAINNILVTTYGGDGMFASWNLSIYICLSFVHAKLLACDLMLTQLITCWLLSHKLYIWVFKNVNNVFFRVQCYASCHVTWFSSNVYYLVLKKDWNNNS
jgi:hypothetical protein